IVGRRHPWREVMDAGALGSREVDHRREKLVRDALGLLDHLAIKERVNVIVPNAALQCQLVELPGILRVHAGRVDMRQAYARLGVEGELVRYKGVESEGDRIRVAGLVAVIDED